MVSREAIIGVFVGVVASVVQSSDWPLVHVEEGEVSFGLVPGQLASGLRILLREYEEEDYQMP